MNCDDDDAERDLAARRVFATTSRDAALVYHPRLPAASIDMTHANNRFYVRFRRSQPNGRWCGRRAMNSAASDLRSRGREFDSWASFSRPCAVILSHSECWCVVSDAQSAVSLLKLVSG